MSYLISALFIIIPVAAIAFFIVSLCLFISARKKNRQAPGGIDEQTLSSRKTVFIISCVVAGVLVAVVIGFGILFALAIRNM